jgi:ribosomal protein L29
MRQPSNNYPLMKYQDIQKKTDAELTELVIATQKELRTEKFKDKFTKKSSVIAGAKKTIAQSLTEITARRKSATK